MKKEKGGSPDILIKRNIISNLVEAEFGGRLDRSILKNLIELMRIRSDKE